MACAKRFGGRGGAARVLAALVVLASSVSPLAQDARDGGPAPGAPGRDAVWESAGKTAVGTSNTTASKVWFTLRGGVMTEVYYPTVDVGNVQKLELIIAHAQGESLQTESRDTVSEVIPDRDSLSFTQVNTAKSGEYRIEKRYTADPERNVVLVRIRFRGHFKRRENDYRLFVYYDPSLNNSGMHDTGFTEGDALVASDGDKASALVAATDRNPPREKNGFVRTTNGFAGTSDGLTLLERGGGREFPPALPSYRRAENGNVVQLGELEPPAIEAEYCCREYVLALGFGKTTDEALRAARASLAKGFEACEAEYVRGWRAYLRNLRKVGRKYQRQFDMAAMVLKAHEDKTYRGAMIASLSVPWGGGASANEPNVGGYHLVWSRDLYQVATAFYALGDKASADRALDYLFRVQQKPDGSFPQNSWLDGRPFWGSLQLDEVAYPLLLAYQLGRTDRETYLKHVRPAADFIVRHGPRTPQERWEEESGYSPSTIAAEIAGLVSAADIARRNGDHASAAVYLAAADEWARSVERWTATRTGKHGDGNYYLRLTDDGNPDDGSPLELNNGAGTFDEREIVDAGFLELVRLGIKRADDPLVAKSLAVVDKVIRVQTPHGAAWYRYNHDGYGEMDDGRPWNFDGKYTGKGRLWVLLSGERGEYELARGQRRAALGRLDSMLGFANEGLMIPEQVWDRRESPTPDFRFGEGTGSATPLAWSMAQFIRLAASVRLNRNVMLPDIVAARYVRRTPPAKAQPSYEADAARGFDKARGGFPFSVEGRVKRGARVFYLSAGERREARVDAGGKFRFEGLAPAGESQLVIATSEPSGATSFQRIDIGKPAVK
ncbi:MAG TPA: glycoside hydrolase family 15 protein [Pyrinomonadaceae bacterium]|nr:glycoside hydrolase family 15 protein [Pyrinomonadaceae bacterium]